MNQTLIVAPGPSVDGTDTDASRRRTARASTRRTPHRAACCPLPPARSTRRARSSPRPTRGTTTTRPTPTLRQRSRAVRVPGRHQAGDQHRPTSAARWPRTRSSPPAWVQKLCYYANSAPCDADRSRVPAHRRVFQSSSYSWNALVAELLSSPLTTNATPDADRRRRNGEVVAVVAPRPPVRGARTTASGFTDVCGLDATTTKQLHDDGPARSSAGCRRTATAAARRSRAAQPADALLPRGHREHLRGGGRAGHRRAGRQADAPGVKQWSSAQPDGRHRRLRRDRDGARAVRSALGAGAQPPARRTSRPRCSRGPPPPTRSQSTFVAACLAPSAVSIGM